MNRRREGLLIQQERNKTTFIDKKNKMPKIKEMKYL